MKCLTSEILKSNLKNIPNTKLRFYSYWTRKAKYSFPIFWRVNGSRPFWFMIEKAKKSWKISDEFFFPTFTQKEIFRCLFLFKDLSIKASLCFGIELLCFILVLEIIYYFWNFHKFLYRHFVIYVCATFVSMGCWQSTRKRTNQEKEGVEGVSSSSSSSSRRRRRRRRSRRVWSCSCCRRRRRRRRRRRHEKSAE